MWKNINKRRDWMIAIILYGLVGCASTELEERCFPLMVGVGYEDGEVSYVLGFPREGNSGGKDTSISEIKVPEVSEKNFEKSKSVYEGHLNKMTDYNHLKVLVLEEDLMEQPEAYDKMLSYLAKTEEFPRNTYVCAVDDLEDLMEIEEKLPQELGTYLEEYLNHHEEKKEYMLTLGDLLDEKENQTLVLYIPYLEVEDDYVEWGGYYAIGKGMEPVNFE